MLSAGTIAHDPSKGGACADGDCNGEAFVRAEGDASAPLVWAAAGAAVVDGLDKSMLLRAETNAHDLSIVASACVAVCDGNDMAFVCSKIDANYPP